jgi:5-methylcytosine-specific restriction endonuclease McrA
MPVFVVDARRTPLAPCHPAVARKLLGGGKAAVFRRFPFTIILDRDVKLPVPRHLRLKVDPGSRVTGLAVVHDGTGEVQFAAEIEHRSQQVIAALDHRRARRRDRRGRKTRYRKPRFQNRRRPKGWLPPSIQSRVGNIETWVRRLQRLVPIGFLSLERVKFDTQTMQNPEITGVEYQQGELAGYEVREYLLEKWQRRCAYCGCEKVPLQIEHLRPRSRGGTNRVSNLTLACEECNQAKGNQSVEEFLEDRPELLAQIQAQARTPLKDTSAVNAARWELFRRLEQTGLPLETGTGGRTKFNRARLGLPKTHWIDAACVGASTPEVLHLQGLLPLVAKAMGHGRRQRCLTDPYGFPMAHRPRQRMFHGFRTGDVARAVVPTGKFAGTYVGRLAVRSRPQFRLAGIDVHLKHLRHVHRADGYDYARGEAVVPHPGTAGLAPRAAGKEHVPAG